ncbi:BspA family leucine-rich repeat surface protein [Candidatus Enterococcus avicola]
MATVLTISGGYIFVAQADMAQGDESSDLSHKIEKTEYSQPLETEISKQLTEASSIDQPSQSTESISQESSSESVSSSQEAFTKNKEEADNGATHESTTNEETTETSFNSSEEKQINEKSQDGWTYDVRGGFAYITGSTLSGNVEVPSTLGGNPIRFNNLDSSIFSNYNKITDLKISAPFYADDVSFKNWTNLETVEINLISISSTSTSGMFDGLVKLKKVDLYDFDTSNITNMSRMFAGAATLNILDVSKFDTSNVTNMQGMFNGVNNINSLNVSNWDTSNVTNMQSMFQSTINLTNIDVSNWNTSKVTNMVSMFKSSGLRRFDASNWDTSKVTSMREMFSSMLSVTSINLSTWDTSNVRDMGNMFYFSKYLNDLDVSNWNTSNVREISNMFSTTSLSNLDVSKWNTSSMTHTIGAFSHIYGLTSLDVSNWDVSKVTNMEHMFRNTPLTSMDLSNWDTSKVTHMFSMFADCVNLNNLDISNWDITSVVKMDDMFYNCPNLTILDLSNWDTSSVTSMIGMFSLPYDDPERVLIVQTNDQKLLTYKYKGDKRIPGGPNFELKDGEFPDGTTITKPYFSKVAMTPVEYTNKIKLSSLEEFVRTNEPTADLFDFVNWTNLSGKNIEQVTNILDELNTTYTANWQRKVVPNIPDGSKEPDNVNPDSALGIAYYPTGISVPKTKLNQFGEQSIPIQTNSVHLGVKDLSGASSWTLRAQLQWDKPGLYGSSIRSDNTGKVFRNENNGTDSFTDNDLKSTTEVTGEKLPTINETGTLIMSATANKRSGVYDYSLGNLTLFIPEAKYIEADQYNGVIRWDLVSAP